MIKYIEFKLLNWGSKLIENVRLKLIEMSKFIV